MATEFFSAGEQARLRAWPAEIGAGDLVRYFTLDADDLGWLSRAARGETSRFGLAVQLCALPWMGFVPDDVADVPAAAAVRLAAQLGSSATALDGYGERAQTRTDHLRLVGERLGWRTAGAAEWKDLAEFLLARAIEHDSPSLLFGLACEFCTGARIIRPGPVALMRAVATARERAATEVFLRVEPLLAGARREELDGLLRVEEPLPVSRLAWLHRGATSASPMAIRAELDKLRYLREIDAHRLDLSMLPAARRRRLAGIGRRATNQALARRDEVRRYPVLLAAVAECAVEVLDEIVGMFDQAVSGTENRARRKLDDLLAARARSSEQRLDLLEEILTVATDPAVPDAEVGPRLREGIGMDRLAEARRNPKDRLPRDHGHLGLIDASFTYLREFVPHVIAAVEFTGSPQATSVVDAVGVLRELYARGGRKVPDDAPTGFVPTRWRGYLDDAAQAANATAYRHYWELCTLLALRNGLRSGDVWVPGSRRYADPATALLEPERWEALRGEYCALVDTPPTAGDALDRAREELHAALGGLEQVLASGEGPVRVTESGQLSLSRLAGDTVPDVVEQVRTEAMRLLHAGVDTSVIALWLGHEQVDTTQIYLHADLALKERALARTTPPTSTPGRYQPPDKILAWLEAL